MTNRAAITVLCPRQEVQRRWRETHPDDDARFEDAPGDRGTEIHLEVKGGLRRSAARAKAMDELRRFKALVETGSVPRSEATPEGELAERKLKQRPAQPLQDHELEKAGV